MSAQNAYYRLYYNLDSQLEKKKEKSSLFRSLLKELREMSERKNKKREIFYLAELESNLNKDG